MERPNNIPMTTKRFWNILRGVIMVLRKGVSKPKLLIDLDIMVKRGKLAGKNMMHNLMFHHHQVPPVVPPFSIRGTDEYEFSCDDTPVHVFKRKQNGTGTTHSNFFSCANAPQTEGDDDDDDDEEYAITQTPAVQAFLRSPMGMEMMYGYNNNNSEASSPALPGFGRTPMVRQLRISDSPFVINDIVEENSCVDAKANEFIAMFYEQLRKQNSMGRR